MKTNLELAREADPEFECDGIIVRHKAIDAFAALVEQRYREKLMGEKVEPVAWQYLFPSVWGGSVWRDSSRYNGAEATGSRTLYTAEQCAAMVVQAMPKRLTREQVTAVWVKSIDSPHAFADAIQDALGIPKEQK